MSNKVKFAIVGCGRISAKHIKAIFSNRKCADLTAVCDINVEKTKDIKKLHRDIMVYNIFENLLKDDNVDVISICTPSGLHAKMAIAAMEAGKDVIIEKPIAMNVRDADLIANTENRTGRFALPVLQNRFNEAIKIVKNEIKNCGKILNIDASVSWYRPQEYYDDGVHGTRHMDGGVLMNQGVHYVDIITYFMGETPKKIYADGGTYSHKMECEDTIALTMKYSDGRIGCLRANTISYPRNFEGSVTLFCEKATIRIAGEALDSIAYWSGIGEQKNNFPTPQKKAGVYGIGHESIYNNFLNCKINGDQKYMTIGEARDSLRIIESAYASFRHGKPKKI